MIDGDRQPPGALPTGRVRGVRGARVAHGPSPKLDDLLADVARGDEQAYEGVYDLAAGWVLGVARKVLRDPAMAEEVMQEVMLEVWRRASRFDPALGSGTAWVMTLAHRRAVDSVRSERSHSDRELRAATAVVEESLERERVQRCLTSLTPLQRQCVSLAYYGGYTYAEVAELLGVPAGTVKTRMRDGLIKLRDCLGV